MSHGTRRILIGAVTGFALGVFLYTAIATTVFAPETDVTVKEAASSSPAVEVGVIPSKLQIPKLEIDAPIEEVGVTARGNMATPTRYSSVGWYKYGALPGERGSAVFAGHVDNGLGLAGVFKHLADLVTGDEIFVVGEDGTELHFVVERIESYPYEDVPTDVLFNHDDASRLNLITCAGSWLGNEKTYTERLIIFAVLQPL